MLEKISLSNFKGFKSASIAFAPLTLLSGLNSSGKSTILQALGVLRQSHEAGFLQEGHWLLNGSFAELGVGSDALHEDSEGGQLGLGLVEDGKISTWKVAYDQLSDVLERSEVGQGYDVSGVLFSDKFQFLRADRVNPQTTSAKSRHAVSQRKILGVKGEFAAHFLTLFQDEVVPQLVRYPENSDATHGLLSQVNAWMQEFSPGVRVGVHDVAGTDFVRLSFAYGSGANSSHDYRPTNVGFGLAYSLPIIIACLATPLGGLVLLENPEAHLHPRGQMAMGRLIARAASAGIQVLVETHSDHLLNGVRLAVKNQEISSEAVKMHFFSRDAETRQSRFVSPGMQPDGKLTFWPEGFFDQWDIALMDLLS